MQYYSKTTAKIS